jgi:hypothetical protein
MRPVKSRTVTLAVAAREASGNLSVAVRVEANPAPIPLEQPSSGAVSDRTLELERHRSRTDRPLGADAALRRRGSVRV